MKFDYRVFQGPYGLEIRGVFYDYDEKLCAVGDDAAKPFGESLTELKRDLQRMLDCTDLPALMEKEREREDDECTNAVDVEA